MRFGVLLACLSWAGVASGAVPALPDPCSGLLGAYEFNGDSSQDSETRPLGQPANQFAVLYPDSLAIYDTRVSHFLLLREGGVYQIEIRTPHGILGRMKLAGGKDSISCEGGVLAIERNRVERDGPIHRVSHYRHWIMKLPGGGLEVWTDISGQYLGDLGTWPTAPKHLAIRFSGMSLPD